MILLRSAHARRPSLFSPAKAAPSPNFRDAPMSLLQGADPFGGTQGGGGGGGKGNQGDPKGPKGNPRAPSAPLGGWAHGALWGYSEAIPNGKPFRVEP